MVSHRAGVKESCGGTATLGHGSIMAYHRAGAREVAEGRPHWGTAASWPAEGQEQVMFRRDGHTGARRLHGRPQGWGKGCCR
jgi:hypothetical protein